MTKSGLIRAGMFVTTALTVVPALHAQTPDTTFFISTHGADTIAIERYVRLGNTFTGTWVQHQGGTFVHHYALVLGQDGMPSQFVYSLYTPRPHTYLKNIVYGRDSITEIVVRNTTATTRRFAAIPSYPVQDGSVLGWDLALQRAHAAGTDQWSVVAALDRDPVTIRFMDGDSAAIGDRIRARVAPDGRLLGLHILHEEISRVASLDFDVLVARFRAADAAERAPGHPATRGPRGRTVVAARGSAR